ncbi:FAD binding domain-containing protein [Chelatococcus asaccharovorans]|uniref:Xanthine dehydrogenase YagS FAD-binding subunit n=1 Tax=Chelatococcus asaccharovorans TaxID=28210 RepID=A0A2V3U0Q1_9HYPH|nr:xanthine dehydrogenase family protein subunit M [Chelatococcus asaccharovorans]MBS7707661.1 xanthine dehydrogenase family protein subunit M [Chelatococcus asaccharovorans]PXW55235.1 xanthine dehydrogenase YagS FAD-binding subunit [Chelatococcus asaccharovorans]
MQPFTYVRASNVGDAVKALSRGAKLLAGGTTLYDLMKLRIERPERIIDINHLGELKHFDTSGERELVFGALARMSEVAADAGLVRDYPAISESLWRAASQQLRNMASLGGNLLQRTRCPYFRGGEPYACNKRDPGSGCAAAEGLDRGQALLGASPSCSAVYPGDFAAALVAFDAEIDVVGPGGERVLPFEELHREPADTPQKETTLEPGEMIVRIRIPVTPLGRASTFLKVRDRESYAFALASAAVALEMDGDVVRDARVAVGGLATRPWRARAAERLLIGRRFDESAARAAGEAALDGAIPGRSNAFRIELGIRTVTDALMTARQRA